MSALAAGTRSVSVEDGRVVETWFVKDLDGTGATIYQVRCYGNDWYVTDLITDAGVTPHSDVWCDAVDACMDQVAAS